MSALKKCFMLSMCDYTGYKIYNIKIKSNDENGLIYSYDNKRQLYKLTDKSKVIVFDGWVERDEYESKIYKVKNFDSYKTVEFSPFSCDIEDLNKKIIFLDELTMNKKIIFNNTDAKNHLLKMVQDKQQVFFDDDFTYQLVGFKSEIIKNEELQKKLSFEEFKKVLNDYNIEIKGNHNSESTRAELNGRPILSKFLGPMWNGENSIRYETQYSYDVLSN